MKSVWVCSQSSEGKVSDQSLQTNTCSHIPARNNLCSEFAKETYGGSLLQSKPVVSYRYVVGINQDPLCVSK